MLKKLFIVWMSIFLIGVYFLKNNFHDILSNVKMQYKYYSSDWQLTPAQWKDYITMMQGFNGHYYPNIIPKKIITIKK
jgi:hypothetical protein